MESSIDTTSTSNKEEPTQGRSKEEISIKSNASLSDVINLDDDDDEIDLTKKNKNQTTVRCMNPNCSYTEDLSQPSNFVLSYFGMKRTKDQLVCMNCYITIERYYSDITNLFKEGKSIFTVNFPEKKDVILIDSDEEDVEDEGGVLSPEVHDMIQNNLEDAMQTVFKKYDFFHQVQCANEYLSNKIETLTEEADGIGPWYDTLQARMDAMRKSIYDPFQQPIKELDELQIGVSDDESINSQVQEEVEDITTNLDVIALSQEICEPPPTLPAAGELVRPKLKVNDLVYVMKVSFFSTWVLSRVIDVKNDGNSRTTYRVCADSPAQRKVIPTKNVLGQYMAYVEVSPVRLPVGTRVIARFKEEGQVLDKDNFYSGIVAEAPKSNNKYRYLIFFDDGYAQYVPHENTRLVCDSSEKVWEDIHPGSRSFIEDYLRRFPERPMVKLQPGQIVKTEWKGKWWVVRVLEVDGSLVKVHFDADSRTEWIYRGSTRLGPLFNEKEAAKHRQLSGSLARSRGFAGAKQLNEPYVEYTVSEEDKGDGILEIIPSRAVAKKSTAKKIEPTRPATPTLPEGVILDQQLKSPIQPLPFRPHDCTPACVQWTGFSYAKCKGLNSLKKPLLFGFQRLFYHVKNKRVVIYVTPCGRRVRSYPEIHSYLTQVGSLLTVDLFEFEPWISCTKELYVEKSFTNIQDLSYGRENVAIACVNELDHRMPPYVMYMTEREPSEGVSLNLDKEFLVGCDCTDDCQNPETCSCWQLTYAGAKYCNYGQPVSDQVSFGYQYRRLPERVITGIYECNPQCKCASTCLNRVAQQPLSTKLQLFKTEKKGWGIRTMCDIPKGAFICIYAGILLTEQAANEGGKNYGDEYLAELDYIEVVERLKEDYESDVPAELLEDTDDSSQDTSSEIDIDEDGTLDIDALNPVQADSDEEFVTTWRDESILNPDDIRTRLRKRNTRNNSAEGSDKDDKERKKTKKSQMSHNAQVVSDEDSSSLDTNVYATKCGECRLPFPVAKDRIKCTGPCDKTFHSACCSVKNLERWSKLGKMRNTWMCVDCKQEEKAQRKPSNFTANVAEPEEYVPKYRSVRDMFGEDEQVYIMDAKTNGNIGRYLNHSCQPNVFVQNVFVDTHDLRFPWVAFFALNGINAGTELTWDYNYDVGSVADKVMYCYCNSQNCRGRLL